MLFYRENNFLPKLNTDKSTKVDNRALNIKRFSKYSALSNSSISSQPALLSSKPSTPYSQRTNLSSASSSLFTYRSSLNKNKLPSVSDINRLDIVSNLNRYGAIAKSDF